MTEPTKLKTPALDRAKEYALKPFTGGTLLEESGFHDIGPLYGQTEKGRAVLGRLAAASLIRACLRVTKQETAL